MRTLVFDIETVGEQWGALDATTQDVLSRWIARSTKDTGQQEAQLQDLRESLGFSPLTGKIVCVGVYDVERNKGAVYYTGEGTEDDETTGNFVFKQRTEQQMLSDFWEGARGYDTFVTFNGRGFDVPFLLHRSIVHAIVPTVSLMEYRYLSQQKEIRHVDLQDQLTFYGAMFRKPSLHLFCRAYGIESPKGAGVSGDDVAELFLKKKFRDIARYNARDVVATTKLYEKWLEFLAPASFKVSEIDF